MSNDLPALAVSRTGSGACAFRLMPTDDLAEAPSSASVTAIGEALLLRYTWAHPADGEQEGVLLVSGSGDDGAATATLFDTWHQHPGTMTLTGTRSSDGAADRTRLTATYLGEWGWEIDVDVPLGSAGSVEMVMRNVVPASANDALPEGMPPVEQGPYEAMVAHWEL